jgi:S-(hydroxymethyl)glutathione dehydrogenase / alcohol dehydrogenase
MQITAAILWERGKPMSIEPAELDPPGPGEVLVEIKAAGVCHSDLHPARDEWPMRTPIVLGHEGSGIVREVGANVTRVRPGDHIVICWAPACGVCPACAQGRAVICDRLDKTTYRNRLPSGALRLHARGRELNHFLGTACFADYAVIAEEAAVVVDRALPFDALAMLGCSVVTGVGAVMTAAQVPAGAHVAVIGAGGVGLNVIQGAVLSDAAQIIAIDRHSAPLALAQAFGATEVLQAPADTVDAIRAITAGRGADFVFDTVGTPATLHDAIAATTKGGTVVLTGLSRIDAQATVEMFPFVMQEKRLIGSAYGSGRPTEDIVRLSRWFQDGRLKLRELVTRRYTLNQIDDALDALATSAGARGVITSVK